MNEKEAVISIKAPSAPAPSIKPTSPFNRFTLIKLLLIGIITLFIFANSTKALTIPFNSSISCIHDNGFQLTKQITVFIIQYPQVRHIFLGIGSIIIDFIFLYAFFQWARYGHSWQYIFTLLLFYAVRGVIQRIFIMPFPPLYCWEYPHVPSLVVNYLKTNDFFFSGHVGMPLITGLIFHRSHYRKMAYLCYFSVAYEGFLVLVTRVHYSIDIITGVIAAHYCFMIVDCCYQNSNKRQMKSCERARRTPMRNHYKITLSLPQTSSSTYSRGIIETVSFNELRQ